MTSPSVTAALRRLTTEHQRYFPEHRAAPQVLSITPQLRRLSEIAQVELGFPGSRMGVYIKIHRHPNAPAERVYQKARLEFDTLSYLYERLRGVPGCAVVRPIAFFPEHPTVVTEAAEGRNLHGLLKQDGPFWRSRARLARLGQHCREAGVWLRHFQAVTNQGRQAPLPLDPLFRTIRDDLAFCHQHGLSPARIRGLEAYLDTCRVRLSHQPFPVVGQHPDFQADNILVCPGGVTVLDFTSFRYGAPWSDSARFVAHVQLLRKNPAFTRSRTETLCRAFLDGYAWERGDSADGFAVFLAFFVLRAARTTLGWRVHPMIDPLLRRRTIGFLSRWSQDVPHLGETLLGASS